MELVSTDNDPLGVLSFNQEEKENNIQKKIEKLENEKWRSLSFEQEIYLKKLIIKHCMDQQFQNFIGK